MRVVAAPSQITLWAPAKINLFLEILGRRTDGYHELETLIAPVGLCDTLVCRTNETGRIELRVTYAWGWSSTLAAEPPETRQTAGGGKTLWSVPGDHRNLVFQAVDQLRTDLSVVAGISIHLHKRIPSQAGLGGGSSDAAAALVAANSLWGLRLTSYDLHQRAARIGSDVPFFLAGGPAICRGRGEIVEPLQARRRLPVVIVKPRFGLETAVVFRNCKVPERPVLLPSPNSWSRLRQLFFNRLQSPAEALQPRMMQIKNRFAAFGVTAHQMTGSGSAYFGMLRHTRDAIRIAQRVRQANLGQVFLTYCMI